MSKQLLILLFSAILTLVLSFEDEEDLFNRYKYYQKISKFSNDTVHVAYDKIGGLTCKMNKDVKGQTRVLEVPKNYSLCPYDLYPFKYELISALTSITFLKDSIGKEQKMPVYVLTYNIMYYMNADKSQIKQYILDKKLEDYYDTWDVNEEIRLSFPRALSGVTALEKEHYQVLKDLGYPIDKEVELENVFRGVLHYIKSNNLHFEMLFAWISDFDSFKYAHGVVMSRSMTMKIHEYKILNNITNVHQLPPIARKNFEINTLISQNVGCPCVINFIDLCNHYQPKYMDLRDKRPIILDTKAGYFINTVLKPYVAGEENSYTYAHDPSNIKMFLHYGFIMRKNIFDIFALRVDDDYLMTLNQFNLCRELGCVESMVKDPLKVPKTKNYFLRYNTLAKSLVNHARVKYLKPDFDTQKALNLLLNDKIISFENEIKSWLYYFKSQKLDLYTPYPYKSALFKIQQFRDMRRDHEKKLDKNSAEDIKIWSRYRTYEDIFQLDLNFRNIIIDHQLISLGKTVKYLKLNIEDLKSKEYVQIKKK
jgi:hypothetical protein